MMQPTAHITIAIFPFEDFSKENELNIFCRSFSADLITELSKFRQFQIIRLTPMPAEEIYSSGYFEKLNIDYYIQGSFRCEKGILRINVQLYNSVSQHLVWGNRLEGRLVDLGEIQENLLTEVVGVLQQQINHDLLSAIKRKQKVQFSAYEHWLHGMDELKKGSVESDEKAREHFQQALAIQPDYSLACTGMSLSYFNEWSCQMWDRWEVCKSGAFLWAQKAIELDDDNYLAAVVLGKIFLYEGSYTTSEYYLRKSLQLNPNDPGTLILIAAYFVFLGLSDEAVDLYERTLRLTPFHNSAQLAIGAFIFFEKGDFHRAEKLIVHTKRSSWADAEAYNAGIYFHLGQFDKMNEHWQMFLDTYRRLISKGADFKQQDAIEWLIVINPHRSESKLHEFLNYLTNGSTNTGKVPAKTEEWPKGFEASFIKENGGWSISFDNETIFTIEVKGLIDLRKLLSFPGQQFHCSELMGSSLDEKGEKHFDTKAKKQYEKKILELQAGIAEAEMHNNYVSLGRLQEEYDSILDHLSQSLGFRGKVRESNDPVEKARAAVTWRIRHAIAKIEAQHPRLGAHLSNSIKTGTFCSYNPEREVRWST